MRLTNIGMVFPGQGSQSVGMLSDIAEAYPEIRTIFSESSDVLHYDLWRLVQTGPKSELDKTIHTQPALLAASYAIYKIISPQLLNTPISVFAGHSLGEYTALVCAKSLNFNEAIKLVAARAQYMQNAVPAGVGAMAAIVGLESVSVEAICRDAVHLPTDVLTPANYNSLGQVVIAGHKHCVDKALVLAKERGAKMVVLLPVSVPSHCPLMYEAAQEFGEILNAIKWRLPLIPVVNNVEVAPYESVDAIKEGLKRQLYSPVRWVETIQYFVNEGITTLIECGPGNVLTGLNKRINKQLQLMTTMDLKNIEAVIERGGHV